MKALLSILVILYTGVLIAQEDSIVWDRERVEEYYRVQDSLKYISPEEKDNFVQTIINCVSEIELLDSFFYSKSMYLANGSDKEKAELEDPEGNFSLMCDKWEKSTYDWFKTQGKCKSFSITDFKMKSDGVENGRVFISGSFWHTCGKKTFFSRFAAFKVNGKIYLATIRIPKG